MTKEALIATFVSALSGHADFLESLKALHPDLATMLDPKIAELRSRADVVTVGNAVAAGISELQRFIETRQLDPRPHPSDLA